MKGGKERERLYSRFVDGLLGRRSAVLRGGARSAGSERGARSWVPFVWGRRSAGSDFRSAGRSAGFEGGTPRGSERRQRRQVGRIPVGGGEHGGKWGKF
jgi:hypothetical protein